MEKHDVEITKSNMLIGAKYETSLLELKITYLALYKLQNGEFKDQPDGIEVKMRASEMAKFFDTDGKGLYSCLKPVAFAMSHRVICFDDPVQQSFRTAVIMPSTKYENGEFSIRFNRDLKEYLLDLNANFTKLPKSVMMSFQSVYSFRLYEALKAECFYPKGYRGNKTNVFTVEKSIAELRFLLGTVDMDSYEVQKYLTMEKHPNYEVALTKAKEIKNEDWRDFKKRVIQVALSDINQKVNDMKVVAEPIKGYRGKIEGMRFICDCNTVAIDLESEQPAEESPSECDNLLNDTERFVKIAEVVGLLEEFNISAKGAHAILKASGGDLEKIKREIPILREQKEITNVTGWMISAVRDDYSDQQTAYKGRPGKWCGSSKNSYKSMSEHTIDWQEMERNLLEWGGAHE